MALTSGSKILVSDITNGLNDKMPITGGTVTGSIFRRNVDNLYLAICGGSGDPTSHTSGSVLAWGKDHASYPGYSALWAADGTNTAKLVLTPTGKCTAAGKDVVRSINNIEADDAGNVNILFVLGVGHTFIICALYITFYYFDLEKVVFPQR